MGFHVNLKKIFLSRTWISCTLLLETTIQKTIWKKYVGLVSTKNENTWQVFLIIFNEKKAPWRWRSWLFPGTNSLLYDGFTKEGKGRYQYLHARTYKKPEQKYDYPLTSSWEYGWRLGDVVKEFRAPQFGRSRIVRDTFFRRNGILYEPISAWPSGQIASDENSIKMIAMCFNYAMRFDEMKQSLQHVTRSLQHVGVFHVFSNHLNNSFLER